jgi:hypothetical protein
MFTCVFYGYLQASLTVTYNGYTTKGMDISLYIYNIIGVYT